MNANQFRLRAGLAPLATSTDATVAPEQSMTFEGLACVYNVDTDLRAGGFKIRLRPGCFAAAIKTNAEDIRTLHSHDDSRVLARLSAGTMSLADSAKGLRIRCTLADSPEGRSVWAAVLRRDLYQMSVGFGFDKVNWLTEDGVSIAEIVIGSLAEVSLVCWPALRGAVIAPILSQQSAPAPALTKATPIVSADVAKMRQMIKDRDARKLREFRATINRG